jgi:hypothetical protein
MKEHPLASGVAHTVMTHLTCTETIDPKTTDFSNLYKPCHGCCDCGNCGTFSTKIDFTISSGDSNDDTSSEEENEATDDVEEHQISEGDGEDEEVTIGGVYRPSSSLTADLNKWTGNNGSDRISYQRYKNRKEITEVTLKGEKHQDVKSVKRCLKETSPRGTIDGVTDEVANRTATKLAAKVTAKALKAAQTAANKTEKELLKAQKEASEANQGRGGRGRSRGAGRARGAGRGRGRGRGTGRNSADPVGVALNAHTEANKVLDEAKSANDEAERVAVAAEDVSWMTHFLEFLTVYMPHYFLSESRSIAFSFINCPCLSQLKSFAGNTTTEICTESRRKTCHIGPCWSSKIMPRSIGTVSPKYIKLCSKNGPKTSLIIAPEQVETNASVDV